MLMERETVSAGSFELERQAKIRPVKATAYARLDAGEYLRKNERGEIIERIYRAFIRPEGKPTHPLFKETNSPRTYSFNMTVDELMRKVSESLHLIFRPHDAYFICSASHRFYPDFLGRIESWKSGNKGKTAHTKEESQE